MRDHKYGKNPDRKRGQPYMNLDIATAMVFYRPSIGQKNHRPLGSRKNKKNI